MTEESKVAPRLVLGKAIEWDEAPRYEDELRIVGVIYKAVKKFK